MGEKCAGWSEKRGERHPCQFANETDEFSLADNQYCRFHLPMGGEGDGGKRDWDNGRKIAISDAVIERIDEGMNETEVDHFEDDSFDLDFGGIIVPAGLDLSDKTIPAIAFAAAQFIGKVIFRNAQFTGDAYFKEAKFRERADFFKAQFFGDADFRNARFSRDAYFYGVQFTGDANFSYAQVTRETYFRKAQFSQTVGFSKTQLRGDANFSDAQFTGETNFGEAALMGDAYFRRAKFTGGAEFSKAMFSRSAYFRESEFVGSADFNEAQFSGYAGFGEAQFSSYAGFSEAKFCGNAYFKKAKFEERAVFSETQFSGSVLFGEAQLAGKADFHGDYGAENGNARSFKVVSFQDALFGGPADFSNREILKTANFRVQQFTKAPSFAGSRLHQDTTFPSQEHFLDRSSERAPDSYRVLRLAMENQRDRLNEGMFYALEQESRRRSGNMSWIERTISLGYGMGSEYGLEILRPLLWLIGGILATSAALVAVWFHFHADPTSGTELWDVIFDTLWFSAKQSFVPFEALRAKDVIYSFNPDGSGWLRALGLIQTLYSAVTLLLFILAVRWRYRR